MQRACSDAGLRAIVTRGHESMSRAAADLVVSDLKDRPEMLLCASAGGTPRRAYELIARLCANRPRLVSRLRVLQIDEWAGLPRGHPATCEADLRRSLVDPLGLEPDRLIHFNSAARDPAGECRRIQRWLLRHGPIDFCILGLGTNGHVAMNEPAEALTLGVHVATLASSSLRHPLLRGLPQKPRRGLTLGMADILASGKILLLVSGSHKTAAFRRLMTGKVDTGFPASLLWLHRNTTVLCDREAAGPRTGALKSRVTRNLRKKDL